MPMKQGSSSGVVSSNIKEMMRSGRSQKQAIASALSMKRKSKKMGYAEGGMVGSEEEFNDNADPMVDHKGHGAPRTPPKMESMAEMDDLGVDSEQRSLNEIRMEGEYYPSEVANPNEMNEARAFAAALKRKTDESFSPENVDGEMGQEYAMGGLVQGMKDMPLGNKPSEDMDSAEKEDMDPEPMSSSPMEHKMTQGGSGMGLSMEAKAALMRKKQNRRFVR